MKLIGTYLSPYARRVAAALISRGLPFDHEPVNGYQEFEAASRYNPVAKVPSLVLDDGEVLIDSTAILDYLNELVPSAPLIPAGSRARRTMLKLGAPRSLRSNTSRGAIPHWKSFRQSLSSLNSRPRIARRRPSP
jgi:glutathione S-transferase